MRYLEIKPKPFINVDKIEGSSTKIDILFQTGMLIFYQKKLKNQLNSKYSD